jgi:hypothetical protein
MNENEVTVVLSSGGHIQNQSEWDLYLADSIPAFPFWVKIDACGDKCKIEHLRLEADEGESAYAAEMDDER